MELKSIVAATDFSEASMVAVETAFSLAMESGAELYLLHVVEFPRGVDPVGTFIDHSMAEQRQTALEHLKTLIPQNREGIARVETVVEEGAPAKVIATFARDHTADMIIVGTHGRKGLARILMGSTAETLLHEASCQVLVVKQKTAQEANVAGP